MICAKVSIGLHLPTEPTIREVFRAGVALGLQLPRKRTEQLALLDRFKKFLKSQVRNSGKVPGEQLVREFPERPDSLPEQWKIGYEKEPSAGVMLEAKHMTPEYTISLRSSDKHVQNERAEVEHPAVTTGVSSMERAMRMMAEMFQGVLNKNTDDTGCNLTMTKPRGRRPLMLQDAEEHDTPTSARGSPPEPSPRGSPPEPSPRGSPPAPSPPAASPSATATAQTAGMRLPTIDVEEDEEDAAEADAAAYRAAKMKRPAAAAKLPGAAGARKKSKLAKRVAPAAEATGGVQKPKLPKEVAPTAEATGGGQKPKLPKGVAPAAEATGRVQKPKQPKRVAPAEARPAKMETGDPTVFYKGGKIHRNEKATCFRVFMSEKDKCDKKIAWKTCGEDAAWEKACKLLEDK